MRDRIKIAFFSLACLALLTTLQPRPSAIAQESGAQIQLRQRPVSAGPTPGGSGELQTGEVNTLSAAVASATLTQVIAAPTNSANSTYLAALVVEKATASTGSVTVKYGTGTNCATGTTVLLGPITVPPVGVLALHTAVPAGNAVCLLTDASTTSVRALGQ